MKNEETVGLNQWFTKCFSKFAFWIPILLLSCASFLTSSVQGLETASWSPWHHLHRLSHLIQSVPKHPHGRKFIISQGTLSDPYPNGKSSNAVTMS